MDALNFIQRGGNESMEKMTSFNIKMPLSIKKYLKITTACDGITMTEYILELIKKDKVERESQENDHSNI